MPTSRYHVKLYDLGSAQSAHQERERTPEEGQTSSTKRRARRSDQRQQKHGQLCTYNYTAETDGTFTSQTVLRCGWDVQQCYKHCESRHLDRTTQRVKKLASARGGPRVEQAAGPAAQQGERRRGRGAGEEDDVSGELDALNLPADAQHGQGGPVDEEAGGCDRTNEAGP
ncbi:hypothetical protein LTR51_005906 [Lithohypha guttulata]|nr:hypothetical protein LTR51_005906 [Lithohypha guttulata]